MRDTQAASQPHDASIGLLKNADPALHDLFQSQDPSHDATNTKLQEHGVCAHTASLLERAAGATAPQVTVVRNWSQHVKTHPHCKLVQTKVGTTSRLVASASRTEGS